MPERTNSLIPSEEALALAVALSRITLEHDPQAGDLVIETSWLGAPDPDAIGWLMWHGMAAYADDGTGPKREVWDITPLSGALGVKDRTYQRWENAQFKKVPDHIVERLGLRQRDAGESDRVLPDATKPLRPPL